MPANANPELQGVRVLVVEDTALVADMIVDQLEEIGCQVVGPVGRLAQALPLARDALLDVALLDVNLAGERCFPIAETLRARGVPFAFLTGYGESILPPAFRSAPRLGKPFSLNDLVRLVATICPEHREATGAKP